MSTFQLLLLVLAGAIFYLFFKQLFSGSFPKRGVDFEAKRADEQIGGINRPDKTFSTPAVQLTRMEQLLKMADTAIAKEDLQEAEKALQSALILDENSIEALQRIGYVAMQQKKYQEAKEYFEKILSLDESDDMVHASLANALHQLGDEEGAKQHHERAIALDPEYAPHHFNYANTLYDLGCKEEALIEYKKAFALDSELEVAKKMIKELSE